MPILSRFFGIVIRMFYNDHAPPHFHAEYGEYELVVAISPIRILHGDAPHRVRSMVIEWTGLHQRELLENWDRSRGGQEPARIEPLI
jgi:hypothetical protein